MLTAGAGEAGGDRAGAPEDPFGWVGGTLGGLFVVYEVVAEGGFGIVYRGYHRGLDMPVAIKCLKLPRGASALALGRLTARLRAEARLLHELSRQTAGVVQALHAGATLSPIGAWTPYLVMEWLEGDTLEQHLDRQRRAGARPAGIAGAARLLAPLAAALSAAHAMRVAHLDLKPANLVMAEIGARTRLKVLDFGLAERCAGDARAAPRQGGARAFTPRYGAPEQFSAQYGAPGTWTDVFALALLLVEVASGRPALEGDCPKQLFAAAIDEGSREALLRRVPGLSEQAAAVLRRALDVSPELRFRTARELWAALRAALRGGGRARAAPGRGEAEAAPPSAAPATSTRPLDDAEQQDVAGVAGSTRRAEREGAPPRGRRRGALPGSWAGRTTARLSA